MSRFAWVVLALLVATACAYAPRAASVRADDVKAMTRIDIVTADSIEREEPAIGAEADSPGQAGSVRVDIPTGWTLENTGGDSVVMSHGDGSRATVLQRRDGCSVHVTFRQGGMDCVSSFDCRFDASEQVSDQMFVALSMRPDRTLEVRYFLVSWPPRAVRGLLESFIPDRRYAVCTR